LQCLIASPAFAEFCIPLLLEKLDSQLRIAKLDSLRLLVSSSALTLQQWGNGERNSYSKLFRAMNLRT
jgi:hypothetical protein